MRVAEARLDGAREKALEAQQLLQEAKAATAEISALLAELRAKRQRVGEAPAAVPEDVPLPQEEQLHVDEHWELYSLNTWRKLETEVQQRRLLQPRRGVEMPPRRRGARGPLEHWRRGLVGCLQDWAEGSLEMVIFLITRLIEHFGIVDDIYKVLKTRATSG